ncbi:MAG: phage antirepressor protein [Candidatus Omnitrophica bacterium]|nr:phage antirepressor protein [Candidatus Omnitrophota bacterium]
MTENKIASKKGGGIAKRARKELEKKTGRKIVSKENFLPPLRKKKIRKK